MPDKKRKSFVLHLDVLSVLNDLTDEQAGKLFKAIKSNRLEEDLELDAITKIAFSPFKAQFVRDDEKYQKIVERNKNNGSKGGRPTNPEEPKKPSGLSGNPKNPKKADSDSDSDSDSDKEVNNKRAFCRECFDLFWNSYPKKADKKKAETKFKLTIKHLKLKTEVDIKDFCEFLVEDCKRRFANTDKKFIPLATTYLNGERWNDEL